VAKLLKRLVKAMGTVVKWDETPIDDEREVSKEGEARTAAMLGIRSFTSFRARLVHLRIRTLGNDADTSISS
jgi:hypothetical protein